jgi:exosortase family protein XrtF
MAGFFMLKYLKQPIFLFFLKFLLLYFIWFLFYEVYLRSPGDYIPVGESEPEKTSSLDFWVIQKTTATSANILDALGYDVFFDGGRSLKINDSGGVWVGDSCNAISIIALFAGIIISLNGIWWHKLIFILIGSFCIWLLNVLRLILLTILSWKDPASVDFNHTYTFTIIIYAFVIGFWLIWIHFFNDKKRHEIS